jgi:lipopolysaccharide cholinephosphotransferase
MMGEVQKEGYLEKSKSYKGFHHSIIGKDSLEYIHNRSLEMFMQVKSIFEQNGIKYMICGGTLLGAMGEANGHFIPWDDDFDLCIFEEDYDKAIECLTNINFGLTNGAILQCSETDPNYYLGWMKIRDMYTHTYPDAPKFKENGVWIDLYKLVKTDLREVPLLIAQEELSYLDRRFAAGGLSKDEYDNRVRNGNLLEKLNEAKQNYISFNKVNREVYIIWSASKVVLNAEWVEPLRTVVFEGIEVTTFNKPELYLQQHYGSSFMTFPAEENRRVGITHIDYLDSGA